MSTVSAEHILKGGTANFGPDGFTETVIYHVSGVTANARDKSVQALTAPGIPQYGNPHPVVPGVQVRSVTAEPLDSSPTKWRVTVQYEQLKAEDQPPDPSQPVQGTTGGSLTTVTTQKDVDGNQISVSHTFTDTDANGNEVTREETQGGEVEYQLPVIISGFTRVEAPALFGSIAKFYVGKINSSPFLGGVPGTWMCTRLESRTDDGGQSYVVTYEFQYNEEGWKATVVYIDPETGRPPADLVEGVGIKDVEVYKRADFNNLGLVI